jgi:uncharacterized membrane protein required for colicin V production
MPGGLPPLDFLLATVLVLVVVNGGRRGFLKESAMLAGVVVGAIAARQFGPLLARIVWHEGVQPHNAILAYLSVLAVVLLAVAVGASMIQPVLNNPMLRTLDLVAGLFLGACEGLLLVGSAASFAGRLGLINADASRLGPFFAAWAVAMLQYVPGDYSSIDKLLWFGTSISPS